MSEVAELPRRPMVPVAAYGLAAVVLVERACLRAGWADVAASVAAALVGVVATFVLWRMRGGLHVAGLVAVVAVASLAGLVAATLAARGVADAADALSSSAASGWTFQAVSDSSLSRDSYRCRARATRDGSPSGVVWLTTADELTCGEVVTCVGRFKPNAEDEFGVANRMQGICGTVKTFHVEREAAPPSALGTIMGIRRQALATIDPDSSEARAVLAGCVCGYRTAMGRLGTDELFSRCGVAHLVAVSGGHIAVVSAVLSALMGSLPLSPRLRAVLVLATSLVFVVFCGAPPSAVRSWLMVAAAAGAGLVGRRGHSLSAVCVAGIAMALVDPTVTGQLGFLLSVTCVVGLCLYAAYFGYLLDVLVPRATWLWRLPGDSGRKVAKVGESLRQTLAATLVSQVVTCPMTVETFGELSLVAPLANVLLAPLFTPLIALGLVEVVLSPVAPAAAAVRVGTDVLGGGVMGVLDVLGSVPHAAVSVGSSLPVTVGVYLGLVGLLVIWPHASRRVLVGVAGVVAAVIVAVVVRWRVFAPPRICVLDVGQGDAILVQDGASCVLVDTGPDESVVEALRREHVLAVDDVVLTHLHDDHYGGVDDLAGKVGCGQVLVAEGVGQHVTGDLAQAVQDLSGGPVAEIGYGDVLTCGNFRLRVVSPTGAVTGDQNADSVELEVSYEGPAGKLEALLTGDAERDETGAAIDRGDVGDIDFLKVGHHGSAVSISRKEAEELDPEVAVASAGEHNDYGHPTQECIDVLEGEGALFLCTKDVGDVTVSPGVDGPRVTYDGA